MKLAGTIKQAVIHVTGVGFYEVHVNGKLASSAKMEPGFSTNLTERLLYSTYALPDDLLTGANSVVLSARIGAGKWSLGQHPAPSWGLLAELKLTMTDGTTKTLSTDKNWVVTPSPVVFENLYVGEIYDARLEQPGGGRAMATQPQYRSDYHTTAVPQ
jgi:alpha-L-rhamnosidase